MGIIGKLLKVGSKKTKTSLKGKNKIQSFVAGMDSARRIDKAKNAKKNIKRVGTAAALGAGAYYEGKTGNISKAVKKGTKKAMGTVEKVIKRAETALKKNPDKYLKRRPPLSGAAKKNKK